MCVVPTSLSVCLENLILSVCLEAGDQPDGGQAGVWGGWGHRDAPLLTRHSAPASCPSQGEPRKIKVLFKFCFTFYDKGQENRLDEKIKISNPRSYSCQWMDNNGHLRIKQTHMRHWPFFYAEMRETLMKKDANRVIICMREDVVILKSWVIDTEPRICMRRQSHLSCRIFVPFIDKWLTMTFVKNRWTSPLKIQSCIVLCLSLFCNFLYLHILHCVLDIFESHA